MAPAAPPPPRSGSFQRRFEMHVVSRTKPLAGPRRAFTLVELLVVIGIIALLVGILLPVLSQARKQAQTVKCASNLRQLAIGWTLYAQANGGVACPARLPPLPDAKSYDLGNGPQYRPRWYDVLGSYSNAHPVRSPSPTSNDDEQIENDAFLCPAEPEWTNARNYVYGYNFQFLGNMRAHPTRKLINFPVPVSRIKGAQTVMAADSLGTAAGKPKSMRTAYNADGSHDESALGNHGYTIDPPRLTPESDYSLSSLRAAPDRSAPAARHRKKANVAFCDAHVELLSLPEIGYAVSADESVPVTGATVHNRFFSGTGNDDDPPTAQ